MGVIRLPGWRAREGDVNHRREWMLVAAVWAFIVVFSAIRFQLDLPLTAIVALCLLITVKTERFRRTGYSLAVGVTCGLGMLTKPTFPIYVVAPMLWLLFRERNRTAIRNAGMAVVV